MDERFNKWLLTPLLTLLFVLILYQYVSPTCPAACPNLGDQGGAGEPPQDRPATARGRPGQAEAPKEQGVDDDDDDDDDDEDDDGGAPGRAPPGPRFNFSGRDLARAGAAFDMKGRDVIVFLHIQKTGGTTFGRHLVKNIRLEQPCACRPGQKKCTCHRPGRKDTWLFSRFSTGWSCGLHADWTELTNCVPALMEKKDCSRNHSRPIPSTPLPSRDLKLRFQKNQAVFPLKPRAEEVAFFHWMLPEKPFGGWRYFFGEDLN
uniref:Heparan-sulfate 6-O-sulfotransferase n=1 Tax=Ornithorhynchus anatinus TaxID=9258 RepID=A0A6I8N5I1_ORNAN